MPRTDPLARPEEAVRRVYAYVAYRIGHGPEAEDITSAVIERAIRYRHTYDRGKGTPSAWLVGIARREIGDHAERRAHETPMSAEGLESVERPEPGDLSDRIAAVTDLRAALARLDPRARDLLALRYGADLKAREIADLLHMRTNAVEVALHRALAQLREALTGHPTLHRFTDAPPDGAGEPSH